MNRGNTRDFTLMKFVKGGRIKLLNRGFDLYKEGGLL